MRTAAGVARTAGGWCRVIHPSLKIKPIETSYNGYRFRSRLEARWAVFFDTLGIEYEYEKEGYDLGDAGWYLPDFWLPQVRMWAEVKPVALTENERCKIAALIESTGHLCLELVGTPHIKPYSLVLGSKLYYDMIARGYHVGCCVDCWLTKESFNGGICYIPDIEGGDDLDFDDTEKAVIAVRSARFEHNSKSQTPR